jgi:hypothetical protein
MQVKITTSIDSCLKASFEAPQELHQKTYSDLLEGAIRQLLGEVSPLDSVKMMISQREQELSDLRARAAEIEVLQKQQKQIVQDIIPKTISGKKREELFITGKGTLMNQLIRNQEPNWKKVYRKYGFNSPKDMELYVRKEAMQRGINMSVKCSKNKYPLLLPSFQSAVQNVRKACCIFYAGIGSHVLFVIKFQSVAYFEPWREAGEDMIRMIFERFE